MPYSWVDGHRVTRWWLDGRELSKAYLDGGLVFTKMPPINRTLVSLYMNMQPWIQIQIDLRYGGVYISKPYASMLNEVHSFNGIPFAWGQYTNTSTGYEGTYQQTPSPQAQYLSFYDASVVIPGIEQYSSVYITDQGGQGSWHQQIIQQPSAANGFIAIYQIIDDHVDSYNDTGWRYTGIVCNP